MPRQTRKEEKPNREFTAQVYCTQVQGSGTGGEMGIQLLELSPNGPRGEDALGSK